MVLSTDYVMGTGKGRPEPPPTAPASHDRYHPSVPAQSRQKGTAASAIRCEAERFLLDMEALLEALEAAPEGGDD
jgi:hypothetical protein